MTRLLYRSAGFGLFSNFVLGLVLVAGTLGAHRNSLHVIWLGALLLISAARWGLNVAFARANPAAEQLSVSVRANQVVFEAAGVVLSSRLIDGQFPNVRQLIPQGYKYELQLNGAELTDVVRRISLLAQKNAPLRLSFAEGELTVSARTPDVGEARETLPVPFQGEPFEIGFNPEFLRDGLEALDGGDVVLKLISPLRPGLIESADGSGFLYLIMPIRLNV